MSLKCMSFTVRIKVYLIWICRIQSKRFSIAYEKDIGCAIVKAEVMFDLMGYSYSRYIAFLKLFQVFTQFSKIFVEFLHELSGCMLIGSLIYNSTRANQKKNPRHTRHEGHTSDAEEEERLLNDKICHVLNPDEAPMIILFFSWLWCKRHKWNKKWFCFPPVGIDNVPCLREASALTNLGPN